MSYALKRKIEDAVEALINNVQPGALDSITIFKGCSFSELTTPRVEIVAESARPQIVGSAETGNWTVELKVTVCTHKDDATRTQHGERCEAVEEVILRNDVVELLNGAGIEDLYVMEFTPGASTDRPEGSEVKSEYEATVFCGSIPPPAD